MNSVTEQEIVQSDRARAAAAERNLGAHHRRPLSSCVALVGALALVMGVGPGCAGLEDPADPAADQSEDADTERVAQESAGTAAACDPNVGFTIKDGDYIRGSGSLPCAGTAQVTLQRTILGVWGRDLTWVTLNGAGDARSVVWNCRGSGRYTYRTIVTWRKVGGLPGFKESNHIEVNC